MQQRPRNFQKPSRNWIYFLGFRQREAPGLDRTHRKYSWLQWNLLFCLHMDSIRNDSEIALGNFQSKVFCSDPKTYICSFSSFVLFWKYLYHMCLKSSGFGPAGWLSWAAETWDLWDGRVYSAFNHHVWCGHAGCVMADLEGGGGGSGNAG